MRWILAATRTAGRSTFKAMQQVAVMGTKSGSEGRKIKILAPLIKFSKAEIIKMGKKLRVPYELDLVLLSRREKTVREV